MRKIIKYDKFESLNGFDFAFDGPGYPKHKDPFNLDDLDTPIIYLDLDERLYTLYDYERLYVDWLKDGGEPLNGFNKINLMKVLGYDAE